MRKPIFLIIVLFSITLFSQTLEDKLEKISIGIDKKLESKSNYNIAVYPFNSLKKKETDLTLHIFNEFHSSLKDKQYQFNLMDRETLENYLAEHQLNSESLINKKTAKKFGKLIAADAYVSGKVYIFGSVINLTIKLTDTETGEIITYNSEKIAIDYDMAQFLGIENWQAKKEKANMNKSQNPDCDSLNLGNQCFYNNSGVKCEIRITTNSNNNYNRFTKKIVLPINTKSCFKDLKAGSYSYKVERLDRLRIVSQSNIIFQGNFDVEKCGSKLRNLTNNPIKTISNGNIIKQNSFNNLINITIINPNYYPRKLTFFNNQNESESIIVGTKETAIIKLPKGFYRFESYTAFNKRLVQKGNLKLSSSKNIKLNKDDFN